MGIIRMENIVKKFDIGGGREKLSVLKGITLSVAAGEFLSIVGQSGSGKTTLMNLMGAMDLPSAGS